ncbi:MAG: 30S ribosome-binding factor RbfA [Clostridia bacterium]|nr:30S ribosome-binding factor RbfA [Clostridia bacterium]
MKTSRTQRLDSEYQKEIASILQGALKHKVPDLKGLISVTKADVASDLKTAKIFISIYTANPADKEHTFRRIRENAGFIRHELSLVMRMRTVPYLTFVLDESMEYGSKMDELFSKLHKDKEEK